VVVARERKAARCPGSRSGSEAVPLIRQNVASGTEVHAAEAGSWNILARQLPHEAGQSLAEFKSEDVPAQIRPNRSSPGLRRFEFGIIIDKWPSLAAVRDEMAWRENNRRLPNGTHWNL